MSEKFIPNAHLDFVTMAEQFARRINEDPKLFEVTPADVEELSAAVARFREAFQAIQFDQRSQATNDAHKLARKDAERIIRRIGHLVRANPRVDTVTRSALGMRPRKEKAKILPCPQEPPRLQFVRALHEGNGATPVHELEFRALDLSPAKPAGAVRLELFVDLIPPEERIPGHPGANHGSRPWYLRSYTRSPIKLIPPMARVPMRVIYWARWADSLGNVGPFSATAAAWIEGGSHRMLQGPVLGTKGFNLPAPLLDVATPTGPAGRETTYTVAVIEAQYRCFNPQDVGDANPSLPAPEEREVRRLEGPAVEEAA